MGFQENLLNRWTKCGCMMLLALAACTPARWRGTSELTQSTTPRQLVYGGPLPALERPSLVVSARTFSVRITGLLPFGWKSALPYYTYTHLRTENGKSRISVVYPALANPACLAARRYGSIVIHPAVARASTRDEATWADFPYLEFAEGKALHGPLPHMIGRGLLARGSDTQGCIRLLGEHLVELAHLAGLHGTAPVELRVPLVVLDDFDRIDRRLVDLDFPASGGVKAPPPDRTLLLRTWDPARLPRWVCRLRAGRGRNPCTANPENTIDPLTGQAGGQP